MQTLTSAKNLKAALCLCSLALFTFSSQLNEAIAMEGNAQDAPMGEAYQGPLGNPPHAISMHGTPALSADYTHFNYANPDAPKGGRMSFGFQGTFDSMNQYIVRGTAPRGLQDAVIGSTVYESLMMRNQDEPFTMYGLIADTIKTDPDRTFLEVTIHPQAKFSDGAPLTVDDVLFTFDLYREKARPPYSSRAKAIVSIERIGDRGIRFNLKGDNREFPLLLGLMPIFPKHATDFENFDKSSMTPLIGSGPYVVDKVNAGTRVLLKRNPDYWAKDLPIKNGFDNFDEIVIDYYRDEEPRFEAFRKGLFDINPEDNPERWTKNYRFPAVDDGRVTLETFETGLPTGMRALMFNTRIDQFKDIRVREALILLFDFEWVNKSLFSGAYLRTSSLFQNSDLSSYKLPISDAEREILGDYINDIDPSILDGTYEPPKSDGSGRDRKNLRKAVQLMQEAGYELKDGQMINKKSGEQFAFEFMSISKSQEQLALALQSNMKRLGIDMSIRTVDGSQYWERWKNREFDMLFHTYSGSLSPGSEQYRRWGIAASTQKNWNHNLAGVAQASIDAMIDKLVAAREREDFVTAVRAMDRLILSGKYFIPLYHPPGKWLARWKRVARPDKTPLYGYRPATWWQADPAQ